MPSIIHDVRVAVRTLRKTPVFTAVAVLTLALGIGANTVIFSLVNAAIFHVLPYPDSGELVRVCRTLKGAGNSCAAMSQADFAGVQSQSNAFESLGVYYTEGGRALSSAGTATMVDSVRGSPGLFRALRVVPALGQVYVADEIQPGKDPWMLLSYSFWQKHFGSDPAVIGKTVSLSDRPYVIIGVLPASLILPNGLGDVWIPLSSQLVSEKSRHTMNCFALGRLRRGTNLQTAQAALDTIAQRLGYAYPEAKDMGFQVLSLQQHVVGPYKTSLLALFSAVGLVLMITCANMASLLLAREAPRHREAAVRAALGAGRGRIIVESLTKSLVLSFAGGGMALIVAVAGIHAVRATAPAKIPHFEQISLDGWVLAFTFFVSLFTGALFGLIPALVTSRTALVTSLKQSATSDPMDVGPFRIGKWQNLFSVVQVALALVLLVGAGLLTRSLSILLNVELGFDRERLLTAKLDLRRISRLDDKRRDLFYQQVLTEVRSLPGVESAALGSSVPLSESLPGSVFNMNLISPPTDKLMQAYQEDMRAGRTVAMQDVSQGYFRTMKIPILAGSDFTEQDTESSPGVVIINRTMAQRFWPQESPVGKQINLNEGQCICIIIGVVGDARDSQLETALEPELYRPSAQDHGMLPALIVRTTADSLAVERSIMDRIRSLSPQGVPGEMLTVNDLIAKSVLGRRFNLSVVGMFAGLALLLAMVGIYGVVSHSVAQRTREIGIRMAFGAQRSDVLKLILKQGVIVTLAGLALGLLGTFFVTRFVASLLFGVTATDPLTFTSAVIFMATIGTLATYIPARRAINMDPLLALRHE